RALLQNLDVLVEAIGVLESRLDRAHLPARQLFVDQVSQRVLVELHSAAAWIARARSTSGVGTSNTKSSGRSQNSRNSRAHLSDRRIDSAYMRCAGTIMS